MSQQIPVISAVSSDTMGFMENTREYESRLYQLKWQAFLINIAYEILGEGFYAVHPKKSKGETRTLRSRECFGIRRGFSVNGAFSRENVSHWRSAMNSDDLEEAARAIEKSWTYLQECDEKITSAFSVWWEPSSDETQFFRESSSGRSDKYWFFHLFFLSIDTMGCKANLDEHDIECELPRLFGKYFDLFGSPVGSLNDGMEEEEMVLNVRLPPPFNSQFNSYWDNQLYYNDGRYTMAPARVLANWELDSGKSAFAWPIETFRNRCCDIYGDGGKGIADGILKELFGEMKDCDDVKNIDDLVAPKKTHVRKWTTFENCFAYYSRGLEGDPFPQSFTKDILGVNRTEKFLEVQIDRLFLSFLVFQSEMMAAYLLENTRAVLLKHLSLKAVENVFTVWKERLPTGDRLPEITV